MLVLRIPVLKAEHAIRRTVRRSDFPVADFLLADGLELLLEVLLLTELQPMPVQGIGVHRLRPNTHEGDDPSVLLEETAVTEGPDGTDAVTAHSAEGILVGRVIGRLEDFRKGNSLFTAAQVLGPL